MGLALLTSNEVRADSTVHVDALSGPEFLARVARMSPQDCLDAAGQPRRIEFRVIEGEFVDPDLRRAVAHLSTLGCIPVEERVSRDQWSRVRESLSRASLEVRTVDPRSLTALDHMRRLLELPPRAVILARWREDRFSPLHAESVATTFAGFLIGSGAASYTAPAQARVWAGVLLLGAWLSIDLKTTRWQQGLRNLSQSVRFSSAGEPSGIQQSTGLGGTIVFSAIRNLAWFSLSELAMMPGNALLHPEWWFRTALTSVLQAVAFFPLDGWIASSESRMAAAELQGNTIEAGRMKRQMFWRIFWVYSVAMSLVEVTGFMSTHAVSLGISGGGSPFTNTLNQYGILLTPTLAVTMLLFQRDQAMNTLQTALHDLVGRFRQAPPQTAPQRVSCVVTGLTSSVVDQNIPRE